MKPLLVAFSLVPVASSAQESGRHITITSCERELA
jgi:hypothetical protein